MKGERVEDRSRKDNLDHACSASWTSCARSLLLLRSLSQYRHRVKSPCPNIRNMSQTPSLNKAEDIVHDTLYSALHRFATPSASTSSLADAPHPFGSSAHALATAELRDLIAAAEQASLALGHHFAQSYADPKLVSILKQHTAISHALYQVCTQLHFESSPNACAQQPDH